MTTARKTFFGGCADLCRFLGRQSLVVPRAFNWMADWFAERAR